MTLSKPNSKPGAIISFKWLLKSINSAENMKKFNLSLSDFCQVFVFLVDKSKI